MLTGGPWGPSRTLPSRFIITPGSPFWPDFPGTPSLPSYPALPVKPGNHQHHRRVNVCVYGYCRSLRFTKKMFSDQGRVRDKLWFLVMVCNLDSIQRKSQIKHYHERSCSILSFRRHPLGNLIRGPGNNNLFLVLWMFREGGCCVRLVVDKVWSLPRSPVSPFSPLVPDPEHAEEQVPDSPFSPRIESPGVPGAPGMPSLPCKTPILTAMLSDTNCNAIWY